MASSTNWEYQLDTINEVHTNTQDNTQAAGPRWTPDEAAETTSTIEYQEGAWAIGWPSSVNEIREIHDDLITKYNFQDWSAPVPPVPPVPTTYLTINVSTWDQIDEKPGGWEVSESVVNTIPSWDAFVYAWTCWHPEERLEIYNEAASYAHHVTAEPSQCCSLKGWDYCYPWNEWHTLSADWNPLAIQDGMAVRAVFWPH